MANKIEELKEELEALVYQGNLLLYVMKDEISKLGEDQSQTGKQVEELNVQLPEFRSDYETWYSESLQVVKRIIPERLDDFIKQYKNEEREAVNPFTYTVYDFLIRFITPKTRLGRAVPKMQNQVSILRSAEKRFKSSLFDIKEVLQAELFDSELDAARELCKKGFIRGAGAIAGVVLEKHLAHVCEQHKLKPARKNLTIFVLNQLLQDNKTIDIAQSRFIQRLGDLRNLCDHDRETEPTQDHVNDLIEGTDKVIKTVL